MKKTIFFLNIRLSVFLGVCLVILHLLREGQYYHYNEFSFKIHLKWTAICAVIEHKFSQKSLDPKNNISLKGLTSGEI